MIGANNPTPSRSMLAGLTGLQFLALEPWTRITLAHLEGNRIEADALETLRQRRAQRGDGLVERVVGDLGDRLIYNSAMRSALLLHSIALDPNALPNPMLFGAFTLLLPAPKTPPVPAGKTWISRDLYIAGGLGILGGLTAMKRT